MSRKRQMEKKVETRMLIIDTAKQIVEKEGIEKLSIRKICKVLDYSPGNIYNYFKDKDEIIETILKEGYGKIIKSLSMAQIDSDNPAKELELGFTHYVDTVLEYGREYKEFVLSENPNILDNTRILYSGVHKHKESIKRLYDILEQGKNDGIFAIHDIELTAQALWVSINGLVLRLIIEEVNEEYRRPLITTHIELLIRGLRP